MQRVNLAEKFASFDVYWKPKIVAEVNDAYVKLVKVKGEFVWHRHENEDELFLVDRGTMHLQTREGDVSLEAGDMAVVPRGTEHRPVAEQEAHVLLIEPKSTLNTGNVQDGRTTEAEWI
ncbi:MAG: cupin domain-containing protein [candidate division NC10 bacterium]